MKKRNGFELNKILGQIRSRINFFFLYNLVDEGDVKEQEEKGQAKNIQHIGSHVLEHD